MMDRFPELGSNNKYINNLFVNPRPAGVFGRTRPAGGGRFCPLPNSRTDGRRKTGKTANESSQEDEF